MSAEHRWMSAARALAATRKFRMNDRVEHVVTGDTGIITYVGNDYVLVGWETGPNKRADSGCTAHYGGKGLLRLRKVAVKDK